jgi:hypothetical protein
VTTITAGGFPDGHVSSPRLQSPLREAPLWGSRVRERAEGEGTPRNRTELDSANAPGIRGNGSCPSVGKIVTITIAGDKSPANLKKPAMRA